MRLDTSRFVHEGISPQPHQIMKPLMRSLRAERSLLLISLNRHIMWCNFSMLWNYWPFARIFICLVYNRHWIISLHPLIFLFDLPSNSPKPLKLLCWLLFPWSHLCNYFFLLLFDPPVIADLYPQIVAFSGQRIYLRLQVSNAIIERLDLQYLGIEFRVQFTMIFYQFLMRGLSQL